MLDDQLKYDVNDTPPISTAITLAITHVLVIFDGIIFIPNVLGKTVAVPPETLQFVTFSTIIVAALFTFLQSRRRLGIGAGFILFTGSYSAFLVCSIDAVEMGGFSTLAALSLLTVPLIFLYTYFIRFFRHIITPTVGGTVILLIAISLVPIALEIWAGAETSSPDLSLSKIGVGGITALALIVFMLFGNTILKLWSPLLAIATGYIAAFFTGQLHFHHTLNVEWFGLPPMAWPGIEMDIGSIHIPLIFAFSMAMLASVIENTGNIMLVQKISKRDFRRVSYDEIQGGLYCDGLSKITAGLLGTAVPSIYCDNLPLIEITGVASRRVGIVGAGILLLLAFMPKVSGFMLDMPGSVLGGFLIVIAGLLFHAGIGLVTMNRLNNQHGLIVGLSLVVGLIAESGTYFPNVTPDALTPILGNSVAIGGFTAFFLSTLTYIAPKRTLKGTFKAKEEEWSKVYTMLKSGRKKLQLNDIKFNKLTLCCEEIFFNMLERDTNNEHLSMNYRISKTEEGYFAEIICGYKIDDINNFAMPDSLFNATQDDLKQLGMFLFSEYAHDVKHLEISGYSYISFVL